MHVGVEKAVAQRLGEEIAHHHHRHGARIMAGGGDGRGIAHRNAVDPFAGQHTGGGAAPVDMRHAELLLAAGALIEFGGRRRFHAQVQLQRHRLRQGRDHGDQAQPPRFRRKALGGAGEQSQRFQVAGEIFPHMRAQDLHRHPHRRGVAGLGPVHLGDGGGRQRRAETGEQLLHRLAEGAPDLGARLAFRERRQTVLQMFQRLGHLHADNVGARRQHLAKLDVGRPQSFQRPAQLLAGVRAAAAEGARRPGQRKAGLQQPQGA